MQRENFLDPNLLSVLRDLLDIILSVCNSVKFLELRSLFAFSQKLELTQEIGGEIRLGDLVGTFLPYSL